ncbi:WYL domain-containing protein, partial [Microbispora rosea]|uniref:sigma factor-like helix-turn-helix DNA-binding protein n=1 Tax=Microbispora rosea TaxID=58117 RepID=UPI003416F39F
SYVGPWLPEPLLTAPDVAEDVELAESVSMAMLLMLETLSPTERAVFVLREVFDLDYDEIAEAVGKSQIRAAEELAEPAQRPDRVDLDRAWQERSTRFRTGGEQVTVLVRVDPARREDVVSTALAVLAEESDPDGRLRLEVTFQDPRHAEWALWQLTADAEALAPRWLRDSLRNRAAAIAARYAASS